MRKNIWKSIVAVFFLVVAVGFVWYFDIIKAFQADDSYVLSALFDDVGSVSVGESVKLNGVKIGTVRSLKIDGNYQAVAVLLIKNDIKIPVDSSASIANDGIFGKQFVAINVGFENEVYKSGEEIVATKSALNLEELISHFVFDGNEKKVESDR